MPSPAFSAGHFQKIKTKENAVINCLFYPSISSVVGKVRTVYGKKGKTVTPSRTLQAKDEMCSLQMGKLYYNAMNINYVLVLVYVQNCKKARPLVCHCPS